MLSKGASACSFNSTSRSHGKRQNTAENPTKILLAVIVSGCRFLLPQLSRMSESQYSRQHQVPLILLPIMKQPFERNAIDIVGPLLRSRKGYQYVLVICDYATRYPEPIPLRYTDTHRVAEELIAFFSRMGIPREILSYQGIIFMCQLLKEIYRLLHIHPIRTTPYHLQTDDLVEQFNKTLKSILKKVESGEG